MLDTLQTLLQLSSETLAISSVALLAAGMVRGFSGFGLSALLMAAISLRIPPIQLIPVCFLLEAIASMVMLRGRMAKGNTRLVIGLVAGYAVGIPLGLATTHSIEPETSRLIAFLLILVLALLQMFKISPTFLSHRWGVYVAGFIAGVATGLASVGGMVIALYVLTLHAKPSEIRSALVLFFFASMLVTGFWMISTGTMNTLAFTRGLAFAPIMIVGVLLGTWLFRPSLEPFYKRFCLLLLISLATVGLGRLLL